MFGQPKPFTPSALPIHEVLKLANDAFYATARASASAHHREAPTNEDMEAGKAAQDAALVRMGYGHLVRSR